MRDAASVVSVVINPVVITERVVQRGPRAWRSNVIGTVNCGHLFVRQGWELAMKPFDQLFLLTFDLGPSRARCCGTEFAIEMTGGGQFGGQEQILTTLANGGECHFVVARSFSGVEHVHGTGLQAGELREELAGVQDILRFASLEQMSREMVQRVALDCTFRKTESSRYVPQTTSGDKR